jgi:hypothetical protein
MVDLRCENIKWYHFTNLASIRVVLGMHRFSIDVGVPDLSSGLRYLKIGFNGGGEPGEPLPEDDPKD